MLERTTVKKIHNYYLTEGTEKYIGKVKEVETKEGYKSWLYYEVFETKTIGTLIQDLKAGHAIAVSDRSYKSKTNKGGAGWVIESKDGTEYIRGHCIVPGPAGSQSAYRSELVGLLAILDKLNILCQQFNIMKGGCKVACDGLAALQEATTGNEQWQTPRKEHCDILSATNRLIKKMPIVITSVHVKGHSDDKKNTGFSRLEEMNIKMDLAAKKVVERMEENDIISETFEQHPLSFSCPEVMGQTMTGNLNALLYKVVTERKAEEYWIQKGRYTKESSQQIDWDNHEIAFKREKQGFKRFIAKWTTGMISVGKQMARWKLRHNSSCPMCNEPEEDTLHILKCTNEVAVELWEECQWGLIVALYKIETAPSAIMAMIEELNAMKFDTTPPTIAHLDTDLQKAISNQREIG